MSSFPVVFDDGSKAYVPQQNLNDALNNGGKLAQRMHFDDGSRALVPMDRVQDALKDGGQLIGENPQPPQPQMHEVAETPPGAGWGLYRAAAGVAGLPGAIYHAFADAPRTPEEQAVEATPGPVGLGGPGTGRAVLAAKRLLYDPQAQTYQRGQQIQQQANQQPALGPRQQAALRDAAGAYKMASLVPLVGPLAAHLATTFQGDPTSETATEQQPYGTEADPTGALAEGIGYAATPEVSERIKAGINPVLSRGVSAARGLVDPLSNMTPAEIMSRATKPRNTLRDVMPKIEEALPHARAAADQLGIDVNDMGHDEALEATRKAKQNVWDTLEQNHLAPAATFLRDTTPVADKIQAISDGMSDIAKRRNPALVDRIEGAANDYRGQRMSVSDMEQRIQELNNELYAEQSRLKVQQDTLRRDPAYGHQFAELEGLRSTLNDTLDQVTGPGASDLKRTYGSLKTLEDILDRSRNVANRPSPVGIFQGLGRLSGAGDILGGAWQTATGHLEKGIPSMGQGIAKAWYGSRMQALNDRNFLVGEAFRRSDPGTLPGARPWVPPPPAAAPPPVAPPFAGVGNAPPAAAPQAAAPATQMRMPFGVGQPAETPTPSETAAPAAPETPQQAPQPLTATPERLAQQKAAVNEAQSLARDPDIEKATDQTRHQQLEQQAYLPELEPENLRGKQTWEAYSTNGDVKNPDYTPERRALHERIIQSILDKARPAQGQKRAIFLGGGAASGKTEAVLKALKEQNPGVDYTVIDPDEIKMQLPEWQTLKQSDPLRAAFRLHEESSHIADELTARAVESGNNVIVDKVNGKPAKVKAAMDAFKGGGYQTEARYADRGVGEALNTMVDRSLKPGLKGGRWVPPYILNENHAQAASAFHEVAPYADQSSLHMARGGPHQLVAENGKVYNDVLYKEHLTKGGYSDGDTTERGLRVGAEREDTGANPQQRQEEPAAPAAPTEANRAPQATQQIAGQDGGTSQLLTASGNQYPARYRAVEASDLKTSHNPETFAKNPEYPEGVQERAYHSSKEAQNRVINQAQKFEPSFILNTTPTAIDGPPVTTPDGTVLGGNSRAMTLGRLATRGNYDAFKQPLIDQAQQFGLDPQQVQGMKNPVLVREIDQPGSLDEMRRIASDLNKPFTGALSRSERAVSAGRSLRPESLEQISRMQNELGEDASLRDVMAKRPKEVLDIMQRDGLVTDRDRPSMVDKGQLSEDGKNYVEKALIGSIVDDPDLMDRAPKSILNKLGGSLGDLAGLNGRADHYNIIPLIREALREHVNAAQQVGPLEDYLRQGSMFGTNRTPVVEHLTRVLDGPAKPIRQALRSFAQDARADVQGQGTLGLMPEKPSPVGAFNHAFKTNFTKAEFTDALGKAVAAEDRPRPAAEPSRAAAETKPGKQE